MRYSVVYVAFVNALLAGCHRAPYIITVIQDDGQNVVVYELPSHAAVGMGGGEVRKRV